MSSVRCNELDAASGKTILIADGYNLSLGGTTLNKNSIPPDPEGQGGKFLVSDGTAATINLLDQQASKPSTIVEPGADLLVSTESSSVS